MEVLDRRGGISEETCTCGPAATDRRNSNKDRDRGAPSFGRKKCAGSEEPIVG
jgi:hypothetical protein